MAWCEIPLDNTPFCTRTFKLTLDGGDRNVYIKLYLRYHDLCDVWTARISDNSTGEVLVDNMPLVPGINLLGQYGYLDIGSAYIVKSADTDLMQPDNNTLGTTWLLIWGDDT